LKLSSSSSLPLLSNGWKKENEIVNERKRRRHDENGVFIYYAFHASMGLEQVNEMQGYANVN
jgi:hypothetical protein